MNPRQRLAGGRATPESAGAFSLLQKHYFTNRYSCITVSDMARNSQQRDLFPGALEIMILQTLRLHPMHGYALVKHIKQVSDNLLQVEEGSLYPALQRMLREGWLESELGTSAKGRPTRIYRVTDTGVRHLEREVTSFERMFAGITRVLAVGQA
jgi:PadR family transcriptional regulator PadR